MPIKPLPRPLIKRIRLFVKRQEQKKVPPKYDRNPHYRLLGRLKRADYRRRINIAKTDTTHWSRRVREMDVSRNFPRTELVLKRTHGIKPDYPPVNAKNTIQIIKEKIRRHNNRYGATEKTYKLQSPYAYAVGENIIAMAKTNRPTVDEILGIEYNKTKRGNLFFKALQEKHPTITKKQLQSAAQKVHERTKIDAINLLLIGIKRGKFIFVPLLDLL